MLPRASTGGREAILQRWRYSDTATARGAAVRARLATRPAAAAVQSLALFTTAAIAAAAMPAAAMASTRFSRHQTRTELPRKTALP